MVKPLEPHERVVVGLGVDPTNLSDIATVVVGMPEAAFAAIADGRTHTVSLTQFGLTVEIIIFRGKDIADCRAIIGETSKTLGKSDRDLPNVGIGGKS